MQDLPSLSPRTAAIKSPLGWHSKRIEVSLGGWEGEDEKGVSPSGLTGEVGEGWVEEGASLHSLAVTDS